MGIGNSFLVIVYVKPKLQRVLGLIPRVPNPTKQTEHGPTN
jgi:hypothetical protein